MKLAIVGLGSIGRRHLGNFNTVGVETLTAWDLSADARKAAVAQFPFAKITDTLEAALDGADGVVVCTPPDSHLRLGQMALARNAHVMMEKPLTLTTAGVDEFLRACDAKNIRVLTAYCWRYWPAMLLAEKLMKENRIGTLRAARTEYAYHLLTRYPPGKDYRQFYMADAKQGGGCLLDESHAIDYMRWLCGEIVEVSALVDQISSLEITGDDIADLTVRFASGAIGNIHMNLFAWNMQCHFEFTGEAGVLQWRRSENEIRVFDAKKNSWEIFPFTQQLNDMYIEEARHFVAVVRGEAKPACDGWDGLRTMLVIEAAQRSAAEKRWVKV